MIKLFKPFTSLFRLYKKTKSLRLAYNLLPWQSTSFLRPVVGYKGGKIVVEAEKKVYTEEQVALFEKHGELLLKFINAKNISFLSHSTTSNVVTIFINGLHLKIHANNHDNLKVIEEIFIDQLYDFHSMQQYVVCDVGMNIGAASLYFSSFENVEKVYGFEPFKETFDLAFKNIILNEPVSHKIVLNNYGLGEKDKIVKVPLPAQGASGGTTSDFMIAELKDATGKAVIDVEIKSVCDEVLSIKTKHPGRKIILKLDCEGAEYEIIDVLKSREMISLIDIYMIEYHFKGKTSIVEVLNNHGFLVMSPGSDDVSFYGMLYAVKNNFSA